MSWGRVSGLAGLSTTTIFQTLNQERRSTCLDDGAAAWLEGGVDSGKVGYKVLMPHRLDHLAADHLVVSASPGGVSAGFNTSEV